MNCPIQLPTRKESIIYLLSAGLYLSFCFFVMGGAKLEHALILILFSLLFFVHGYTRKLAMCLLPFLIFAISYDVMRLYPNYLVNPVDIKGLHEADKSLFGITIAGESMTLNEYFAQHTCALADFMAGIFYLCWVPGPIAFGVYCFITGRRGLLVRFAWAFLFLNLIGFAGYYIHPAAPPWFYAQCGGTYDPALYGHTMGNEAGLARFDALTGLNIFHSIYAKNANVFAAVPSLHAAYCPCAFLYACFGKCNRMVRWPLAILSIGICWTAIYSSHHYVIDVLLGFSLSVIFVLAWEKVLLQWPPIRRFITHYEQYVS